MPSEIDESVSQILASKVLLALSSANLLLFTPLSEFLDGSIDFSSIRESLIETAVRSGSFVRPCIEAALFDPDSHTGRNLIIVLGDCNVSDFGEVPVGKNTTVLGVTANEERPGLWKRVLPASAVCSIRGRDLGNHLRQILGNREGSAQVRLNGPLESAGQVFRFDSSGSLQKWSNSIPIEMDFLESDLLILLDISQLELARLTLEIEMAMPSHNVRIPLRDQGDTFADDVADDARRLLSVPGRPNNVEVIADSIDNGDLLKSLVSHYHKANSLARNQDPWFDIDGLLVFSEYLCDRGIDKIAGTGRFDACACLAAMDIVTGEINRLILIGMRKSMHPAIPLTFETKLRITLPRSFSIHFAPELQRWIVEYVDGEQYELDMYNSELIDLGSTSDTVWSMISSGELAD